MKNFDTYLVFDCILAFLGIYLFVSALAMRKGQKISPLLANPGEAEKCKNPKEYIAFMFPRMAVFATVCVVIGILGILGDVKVIKLPFWGVAEMILFLAVFFWFYSKLREARNRFL